MSDATAATPTVLGYGRPRRPAHAGWTDFSGSLQLLALCALVAAISGGLAWASLVFGGPLVCLGGMFGEGIVVAVGLSLVYRLVKLRHRPLALIAAIGTAVAAVLLLYAGLWMREVWHCAPFVGARGAHAWLQLMGFGFTRPYQLLDAFLVPTTGHGGLVGFILYRLQGKPTLVALTAGHLALTLLICVIFARKWTPGAVCPLCAEWLGEGRNAAVIPAWQAGELAAGISSSDVERVLAVVCGSADANLGRGCAVAHLWTCGNCRTILTDLVIKANGAETARLLPPTAIDDKLAIALKTEKVAVASVLQPPQPSTSNDPEPQPTIDPAQG